jgi:aspartate 1-decarboxylase
LETYAIPGKAGGRQIMLNGPAAKKGCPGDVLTIMAFGQIEEKDALGFKPKIIVLDEKNEIIERKGDLARKLPIRKT